MGLLSSPAPIVGPSCRRRTIPPMALWLFSLRKDNTARREGELPSDARRLKIVERYDASEIVSEPPGRGYRAESTQGYPFVRRQAPRAGNALAAKRLAHICRAPRLAEKGAHQPLSVARPVLSTTGRAAFAALCRAGDRRPGPLCGQRPARA